MSIDQIQERIEALERRKRELEANASEAKQELEGAQNALIEGAEGASERATALQAQYTATQGAIENLSGRLERLRGELEVAKEEADRASKLSRMEGLAAEAVEAKKTYDATIEELHRQFEAAHEVLYEANAVRASAYKDFAKLRRELGDGALRELRGVDTSVVTDQRPDPPISGPTAGIILQALSQADAVRYREERRQKEPARA